VHPSHPCPATKPAGFPFDKPQKLNQIQDFVLEQFFRSAKMILNNIKSEQLAVLETIFGRKQVQAWKSRVVSAPKGDCKSRAKRF
jgi:hypothetical protein